ncbi:MAG TPA: sigma-70 family RNA polymerase sigma factor [Kofleriaceae bacterium]
MSEDFETHRRFLVGLAYRMLGSFAEAEDIVQDAFLRWNDTDRAAVAHPRAFLARVVSRLCLDRMKSAAARREQYVGTWLPEPVVAAPSEPIADDLSMALLLTLERLSPLERAAFLLHDVFDMDYSAIAETLGRSEAACRQLAARAREHVRDDRPRFAATDEERWRVTSAFETALANGDIDVLARVLADDAVLYTDGGGKRLAALNPIYGKAKILRFFAGVTSKGRAVQPQQLERAQINGLPGYVVHTDEGVETLAFEVAGDQIVAIYAVRNPDKLRHLS